MAFRLVSSNGDTSDSAMVSLPASGVINPNTAVDFVKNGTGGAVVSPSGTSSTQTMVFGVGMTYVQGASDTYTNVIPFLPEQLWEVDCANAAATIQLGFRHAFSASRGIIHNLASDSSTTGVFLALAMSSLTTGSGKLLGRFVVSPAGIQPLNSTTFN